MSKKTNTTNTTLTGPRSFKATLNRREVTERYAPHEVIVEAATFTFDASDAVMRAVQRALFADYTAKAKGVKLARKWPAVPPSNLPNFTAGAFTAAERQFLGKAVGFRPGPVGHFAPVAGGVANWAARMLHGVVWSRSPYGPAFWVYVEGQGFYSVREADLLTGVNAA